MSAVPLTDPVLTIVGPTASGKTSLAVELARNLSGEIIGLDSRQIYRGMAIGTAQPTAEEQAGIPHHLIGFRDPTKPVSAGEYARWVHQLVAEISGRGKRPLLCGGAGLYYRALTQGIFPDSVSDLDIRHQLEGEYDNRGPEALLEELAAVDPEYAAITHPNNRKRLIRALEIYRATGQPPTHHFRKQKEQNNPVLTCFTVYLDPEPEYHAQRILERTRAMFDRGWIAEVQALLAAYPHGNLPPLDSIGYRQIVEYLKGEREWETLVPEIALRTRQFSKRQRQWFRHENPDLVLPVNRSATRSELADIIRKAFRKRVGETGE